MRAERVGEAEVQQRRLRDDFDPNEALRIVLWIDHLLGLLAEAAPRQADIAPKSERLATT